jgi:hypothetical protein
MRRRPLPFARMDAQAEQPWQQIEVLRVTHERLFRRAHG